MNKFINVKCPVCGEPIVRHYMDYYFNESKFPHGDYDKNYTESSYYCDDCEITFTIIHDTHPDDVQVLEEFI